MNCVVARIESPTEVLREYASDGGFNCTQSMFPNSIEDPCLKLLLSIPRIVRHRSSEYGVEIFSRDLDIPDFHYQPSKIYHGYNAFYGGGKIGEVSRYIDETLANAVFLTVPDSVMFGCRVEEGEIATPIIAALITKHGRVGIEINGLVRLPDWTVSDIYSKGLFLVRLDDCSVIISDLVVKHPGSVMESSGTTIGLRYKIDDFGRWMRIPSPEDCPCGNDLLHDHHLSVLLRVDELIR